MKPRLCLLLLAAFVFALCTFGPDLAAQGKKKKRPDAVAAGQDDPKHDPANAVANLEVHPELQATLFASEPMITNPVNLDIDHRGRVWICGVANCRGNSGKRPEGERILIIEDTAGDGKADAVKTFYKTSNSESAMCTSV